MGKIMKNGVAYSGVNVNNYSEMTNKPKINNVELSGNVTSSILGLVEELPDLSDVDISNPQDGEVLKYDATSGKWENGVGASAETILTQTLTAGNTTLTFTDASITSDSLVSIYVNHAETKPIDLDDSVSGSITLLFNSQSADLVVKLVIK